MLTHVPQFLTIPIMITAITIMATHMCTVRRVGMIIMERLSTCTAPRAHMSISTDTITAKRILRTRMGISIPTLIRTRRARRAKRVVTRTCRRRKS